MEELQLIKTIRHLEVEATYYNSRKEEINISEFPEWIVNFPLLPEGSPQIPGLEIAIWM